MDCPGALRLPSSIPFQLCCFNFSCNLLTPDSFGQSLHLPILRLPTQSHCLWYLPSAVSAIGIPHFYGWHVFDLLFHSWFQGSIHDYVLGAAHPARFTFSWYFLCPSRTAPSDPLPPHIFSSLADICNVRVRYSSLVLLDSLLSLSYTYVLSCAPLYIHCDILCMETLRFYLASPSPPLAFFFSLFGPHPLAPAAMFAFFAFANGER